VTSEGMSTAGYSMAKKIAIMAKINVMFPTLQWAQLKTHLEK
jgi:hypothetical protein